MVDQLTDLESDIMDRVWSARGAVTVREVRDVLERPLAYTTVMTVMDRLFRKGWLRRERSGRSYQYQPALSRSEYTARLMTEVLSGTEDRGLALLHFVETMDPAEYETLRSAVQWHDSQRARGGDPSAPA